MRGVVRLLECDSLQPSGPAELLAARAQPRAERERRRRTRSARASPSSRRTSKQRARSRAAACLQTSGVPRNARQRLGVVRGWIRAERVQHAASIDRQCRGARLARRRLDQQRVKLPLRQPRQLRAREIGLLPRVPCREDFRLIVYPFFLLPSRNSSFSFPSSIDHRDAITHCMSSPTASTPRGPARQREARVR